MATSAIARTYANSCEKGLKLFTQVPKKMQPQVREIIEADGYVINEDGTVTKAVQTADEELEEA